MMQLWTRICQLVLFPLLLLPASFCSTCPQDCTCPNRGSIFCSQRRATTMPVNLPAFTHSLFVFQNGITSLQQQDFLGLVDLDMLDLSQNKISVIPDGVFGSLTSLKNLDLSSNKITQISKDSFAGLVKLERLYIDNNRIQSIHPEAFKGLEQLLELKLQRNLIRVLPALQLPSLLLLDLSFNKIPAPGTADLQTPHLESLKLAGLGLTTLDEGLMRSLGNLNDLDVSLNNLTGMPRALISAKGLIRLNLAANPMGPLHQEDFKNLVGLQELDVSSLNLQGFPADFFQGFPKLHRLTAAQNPFNCVCSLSWFPNWMKNAKVSLGRIDETRCHFPLIKSGKKISELEHQDFGCPATITELSEVLTSSSMHNTPDPTTAPQTTQKVHLFEPEREELSDHVHVPPEASTSPRSSVEHEEHMCPPNICLNGGTCNFDQRGQVNCLCPLGTSGMYCENQDESQPPPLSPRVAVVTVPSIKPDKITFHHVTSTSISLNLHRYMESRPNTRGIRLTYRNLSGPDRRPIQLNVPSSYPEYTLRGLQANCTYLVCASLLDEPVDDAVSSCLKAHTNGASQQPTVNKEPFPILIPILLAVAVVMAAAVVAAVLVVLRRKRAKTPTDVDLGELSPFELEGVKMGLENGTSPQKQAEISHCPSASQNGTDYDISLIQEQFATNNNTDQRIPSYF